MAATFRSAVLGLTALGIFMLVVLHPNVPLGIAKLLQSTLTNTIGLGAKHG